MRISAISNTNNIVNKINNNKKTNQKNKTISFQKGILQSLHIPMIKSHPRTLKVPSEHLDKEIMFTELAREKNINTPKIATNGEYLLHGNVANPQTNPIHAIHIKKILTDIKNLDRASIFHGDLEKGHIFYDKDGSVEIDCFRFASKFEDCTDRFNWEFPQSYMPSNIYDFENNCIGDYLAQINNDKKENAFIRDYLRISSSIHKSNAKHLRETNAPEEQIKFEELQAKLYLNPDEDIIKITKDRIKFKNMARNAFTEWDEGNGACGHEKDEKRTQKGLNMFFDAWNLAVKQQMNIDLISNKSISDDKKELLSYLNEYALHWDNNYASSIIDMAKWMTNPENPNNKSYTDLDKRQKNNFIYLYKKAVKAESFSEKEIMIDVSKNYFNLMLARDEHI